MGSFKRAIVVPRGRDSSRFLVLTKRIAASGDENVKELGHRRACAFCCENVCRVGNTYDILSARAESGGESKGFFLTLKELLRGILE